MALSERDVRHVANLARLAVADDEFEQIAGELNRVLEYIELLTELDTSGVEPTWHGIERGMVLRDDVVKPSLAATVATANAPQVQDGMFQVPRILDEGGEG